MNGIINVIIVKLAALSIKLMQRNLLCLLFSEEYYVEWLQLERVSVDVQLIRITFIIAFQSRPFTRLLHLPQLAALQQSSTE